MVATSYDEDVEDNSSTTTLSDCDEDDDQRLSPDWESLRGVLELRGFHLDTAADVKLFYETYWADNPSSENRTSLGYLYACKGNDQALCRDPGLPNNLFRGKRLSDGTRIVVKAVGLRSHEVNITRRLSASAMRLDPRNHCIPVIDIIAAPAQDAALLVMEEWSSDLIPVTPCCLRLFLRALRSCISHIAFMHEHRMAHLDISLRNLVTDYKGNYACIDYELSRCYEGMRIPCVSGKRGTEIPPELERGECGNPFKIDVWAMGVLLLKAYHLSEQSLPELASIIEPMLNDIPDDRPDLWMVLQWFDQMLLAINPARLHGCVYLRAGEHE